MSVKRGLRWFRISHLSLAALMQVNAAFLQGEFRRIAQDQRFGLLKQAFDADRSDAGRAIGAGGQDLGAIRAPGGFQHRAIMPGYLADLLASLDIPDDGIFYRTEETISAGQEII